MTTVHHGDHEFDVDVQYGDIEIIYRNSGRMTVQSFNPQDLYVLDETTGKFYPLYDYLMDQAKAINYENRNAENQVSHAWED